MSYVVAIPTRKQAKILSFVERLYHSGIRVFAGLKDEDLADYEFLEKHQRGR